jgi:hypothetical protein
VSSEGQLSTRVSTLASPNYLSLLHTRRTLTTARHCTRCRCQHSGLSDDPARVWATLLRMSKGAEGAGGPSMPS